MIINECVGNIKDISVAGKTIDYLDLEWFETTKRIQRKKPDKELMLRSNFFVKDKDFVKEISYMKIVKRQL